jgi:hypothetical protein
MMILSNMVSTKTATLDQKSVRHKIAGLKNRGYIELLDEVALEDALFNDDDASDDDTDDWNFKSNWGI